MSEDNPAVVIAKLVVMVRVLECALKEWKERAEALEAEVERLRKANHENS